MLDRGSQWPRLWTALAVLCLAILTLAPPAPCADQPSLAGPFAVPTFHCAGLYWRPPDGGADKVCEVRYRAAGAAQWSEGLPLWFDERGPESFARSFPADKDPRGGNDKAAPQLSHQYRSSIVNLQPGAVYEIELSLRGTSTRVTFQTRTWSEEFPIAETIAVPAVSKETLVADRSGSPKGYVLYAPAKGAGAAVIDVANERDQCVEIKASYVIIRGLTLKGARCNGVRVFGPAHDVVIEDCDISGWGRPDTLEGGKWGLNMESGVCAKESDRFNPSIERLVIQRSRIHHPRYNTNGWKEYRKVMDPDRKDTRWHPNGPQGISLFDTRGNHVIRYNEIFSDDDHCFNDCIGGASNFSAAGSPNRDSDIYGNRLGYNKDDAIESEGANCNVRIWGNYLDNGFVAIASSATHLGPLYIWRNTANRFTAGFLKAGGSRGFGGGRTYVFHNTLLQLPDPAGAQTALGVRGGLTSAGGPLANHVSRNNVLQAARADGGSVQEVIGQSKNNDFDYDLYNGAIKTAAPQEKHGIKGVPIYDPNNGPGVFALALNSPGYDAGVAISNFNDGFAGKAPDVGAFEAGAPPLQFGVQAYRK